MTAKKIALGAAGAVAGVAPFLPVIAGAATDTFIQASSTNSMLAAVYTGVSDNIDAVLIVVAVAVFIPLTFYVAHLVRGLFPGSRTRR